MRSVMLTALIFFMTMASAATYAGKAFNSTYIDMRIAYNITGNSSAVAQLRYITVFGEQDTSLLM